MTNDIHLPGHNTCTHIVQEFCQLSVGVPLPLLVLGGVWVDHLVPQCPQSHVGALWDIEQLAPVWLHHLASKQGPKLQVKYFKRSVNVQTVGQCANLRSMLSEWIETILQTRRHNTPGL